MKTPEKRQRGRPKKSTPIPDLGPSPLQGRVPAVHLPAQAMLESLNAVERDLINGIRKNRRTVKHDLALGLALEDEFDSAARTALQKQDANLRRRELKYVTKGGRERAEARRKEYEKRLELIREKNQDLLVQMRPAGKYSVSAVASVILTSWLTRGYPGTPPSMSTLRKWVRKLTTSS